MANQPFSDTSYAVLTLLDRFEPATPYQLKQIASVTIFHFWAIPHSQLYTECARLTEGGFLSERREESGRRRREYRLTAEGRAVLKEWRTDPHTDLWELRDPGMLKLFSGADPVALGELQLKRHERRLHSYEELLEGTDMSDGMRLALEAGIGHAREYVRFWSRLVDGKRP